MEHSLEGYLERQSTQCLLSLLAVYREDAEGIDGCIRRLILRILTKRGIDIQ